MGDQHRRVKEPSRKDPLPATHAKYEKIKDLSTGAFGVVQLCRNKKTGQLVAIKFLERVSTTLRCGYTPNFLAELVASCQPQGPNMGHIVFEEMFITQLQISAFYEQPVVLNSTSLML